MTDWLRKWWWLVLVGFILAVGLFVFYGNKPASPLTGLVNIQTAMAATTPTPSPSAPASIVPCGRNQDDPATANINETDVCTICHIVIGGKGLIDWGLKIMTVVAITILFAMAVLYVISAGDEGLMGTAKGGIKAALIGFAVMLSAWLIVNIVLTVLVDATDGNKPFKDLIKTGAFTFSCDAKSNLVR